MNIPASLEKTLVHTFSTPSKASKQRQRKEISSPLPVLCTFGKKDKSPLKAVFQLQPPWGWEASKGAKAPLSTTTGESTPSKQLPDTSGQSSASRGLTLPPLTVADCNSPLSPTRFAVFPTAELALRVSAAKLHPEPIHPPFLPRTTRKTFQSCPSCLTCSTPLLP